MCCELLEGPVRGSPVCCRQCAKKAKRLRACTAKKGDIVRLLTISTVLLRSTGIVDHSHLFGCLAQWSRAVS
jgi:hypothetical protein